MFNSDTGKSLLDGIRIALPEIRDERGALSFIQDGSIRVEGADFPIKRVFWIYDVPEGKERGGHAHRTCAELLFAVKGSFDVELMSGGSRTRVHLSKPNEGILIRPMVWCRLLNFSPDFVGVCLASQDYQPGGYIHSEEELLDETAH